MIRHEIKATNDLYGLKRGYSSRTDEMIASI